MRRALDEQRALLTFDRDYGDLIFNRRLPPPPSVLYLRFLPNNPLETAEILLPILQSIEVGGQFLVVGRDGALRRLSLPAAT